MQASNKAVKRPGGIWAISVLYFMTAAYTLLSFYLVYSGAIPLPTAQRNYLAHLSLPDHAATIIVSATNLAGAAALFLLRRIALHFFVAAFGVNILTSVWHALTKGWLAAIGPGGLYSMLFAWALLAAVCIYTWSLMKAGVLR